MAKPDMVEWFDANWLNVFSQANQPSWQKLPYRDRVFALVGAVMDALVGMDVWQLYEGDAGRRAMEMAESFVAIGLKREAAALRKINAAFPGSAPSADSDERERQN